MGSHVSKSLDSFNCRRTLTAGGADYVYYSLVEAEKNGLTGISQLPYSMKVLLENLLRNEDGRSVTKEIIQAVAGWLTDKGTAGVEIAYRPARVLMQDFTGVPAVVDLAAMRDGIKTLGGDPREDQPAGAGRPRHRPLGHRRRVRHADGLCPQRRARIRAQRRALQVPEVGPAGVPQLPRRAARHRHLPPGQPRISRPDRLDQRPKTAKPSPIPTPASAPIRTPP